jgi:predicted nucleic acid-binding protein
LDITGATVLEAVRGVSAYQMAYWDAQIWASARMNQVPFVFSEDFGEGVTIEGVRFINPLEKDFNIGKLLPGTKLT